MADVDEYGSGAARRALVIDFEGSCMPGKGLSYPIEVALGDLATGVVESWLIRPEPHWMTWDWDPESERVHGIAQAELVRRGTPRAEVARAVQAVIAGRTLVSQPFQRNVD